MSDFSERFASTPDNYRGRAFAASGLVTTATAALAAGVLFQADSSTPLIASAAALVAVLLLLVSVVAYTAAGLYFRRKTELSTEDLIKSIVESILFRMKIAAIAALLAAGAVLVLVVSLLLDTRTTRGVTLVLRSAAAEDLEKCNASGQNSLSGEVSSDQLEDDTPYIRIVVPAGACGDAEQTVRIQREDVALIAED